MRKPCSQSVVGTVILLATLTATTGASAQQAQRTGQAAPKVAAVETPATSRVPSPPAERCSAYRKTIMEALKLAALHGAEGGVDTSAPRATVSELRRQSQLTQVSINVQLMVAEGCSVAGVGPIDETVLSVNALTCVLEQRLGSADSPKVKAACDRANWDRPAGQ